MSRDLCSEYSRSHISLKNPVSRIPENSQECLQTHDEQRSATFMKKGDTNIVLAKSFGVHKPFAQA